jgi:hypothetical protein
LVSATKTSLKKKSNQLFYTLILPQVLRLCLVAEQGGVKGDFLNVVPFHSLILFQGYSTVQISKQNCPMQTA